MGNTKRTIAAAAAALIMTVSCLPLGAFADEEYYDYSDDTEIIALGAEADVPIIDEEDAASEPAKASVSVGKVTSLKVSNISDSALKLKWNAVSGADGYCVYVTTGGTEKLYKRVKSTSCTVKMASATSRKFRVCAAVSTDDGIVEGKSITKTFTTKPAKVYNFTYTRTKKGGLVFKWKAVPRATKYQLYYATSKDGKYTLFKEVSGKKTQVSTALMPKGKLLYFKMRAVAVADNTANGTCSSKIKATVFNTLNTNTIMSRYKNKKSVTQLNAQSFKLSDSSKQKLYNALTSLGGDCSYMLYDVDSGSAVCYNATQYYMPASSVKAPFMLYCLKRMDSGHGSLETMVEYKASQRTGGTGIVQNSAYGTKYSVRRLFELIAQYSDNVAYYMLQDQFGIDGYNNFIRKLGCRASLVKGQDRWGVVNACDAVREWDAIWDYLQHGKQAKFARKIYSTTIAANFRAQLGSKYKVYEKSGWTDGAGGYHHETALIRADHPYVLICLSNRSSSQRMMNVAAISETIHNEMWKHFGN